MLCAHRGTCASTCCHVTPKKYKSRRARPLRVHSLMWKEARLKPQPPEVRGPDQKKPKRSEVKVKEAKEVRGQVAGWVAVERSEVYPEVKEVRGQVAGWSEVTPRSKSRSQPPEVMRSPTGCLSLHRGMPLPCYYITMTQPQGYAPLYIR